MEDNHISQVQEETNDNLEELKEVEFEDNNQPIV
jgi:hypothetical protein